MQNTIQTVPVIDEEGSTLAKKVNTSDDLSKWLPLSEASRILECSEKTVNRYISKGLIERQYRRVPGRRELPVLNPADVEKLKQETVERSPFVVPQSQPSTPGTALARTAPVPDFTQSALLQQLLTIRSTAVPTENKLFLNIEEAANYTGLSESFLSELARAGKVPAMKHGRWLFWREGLRETLQKLLG